MRDGHSPSDGGAALDDICDPDPHEAFDAERAWVRRIVIDKEFRRASDAIDWNDPAIRALLAKELSTRRDPPMAEAMISTT